VAFAWPRCRYPLGSGGNRVCTRPEYLFVFRSSKIMSRIKLEGRGSVAAFAPVSASAGDGFIAFDLTATNPRSAARRRTARRDEDESNSWSGGRLRPPAAPQISR